LGCNPSDTKYIENEHIKNDHAGQFREDITIRPDNSGGGVARVLQHGKVFEKAGCSVSVANMALPFKVLEYMRKEHIQLDKLLKQNDLMKEFKEFKPNDIVKRFTASMSLVFHPLSPCIPTVHANFRYFEITLPNQEKVWWYGGGADLTPMMVNEEDPRFFHGVWKGVCDRHDPAYYSRFKKWCDRYFYSPIRRETRGIGGIFYDDLHEKSTEHYEMLMTDCANNFGKSYFPIVWKHLFEDYGDEEVRWQHQRRGRYVEFNLLYDQGTSYGLQQPNARPEAILMSLPPLVRFEYKYQPKPNSKEEQTLNILKNPKDWIPLN